MSSTDNVAVAKAMYAAFLSGDLDGVLSQVTEDVEYLTPSLGEFSWGGTVRGQAAFRDYLATLDQHFTINRLEQLHFLPGQGMVAVVIHMNSTLAKNRETVDVPEYVQLLSFDEAGKCTRIADVYDQTAMLAAWRT